MRRATKLKISSLEACPVHAILSNIFLTINQWQICNEHVLVQLKLVYYSDKRLGGSGSREHDEMSLHRYTSSMTVPLETDLSVASDSVGKTQNKRKPHKAIKVVVTFLRKFELDRFDVRKLRALSEWKWMSLLLSTYCNFPKGEGISVVRHAVEVKRP